MNRIATYTTDEIFRLLRPSKFRRNVWMLKRELKLRATREIYLQATEMAQSTDKQVKIDGIDILNQFGHPRKFQALTMKLYFRLLQEERDPKIIASILTGIGWNRERLTATQILFLLKMPIGTNRFVKSAFIFAITSINQPASIEKLIALTKDKHRNVRFDAIWALALDTYEDSPAIRQALWEGIGNKESLVHLTAIQGLAARKDSRIKAILKKELTIVDHLSGSSILEAIEMYNDPDFIKLLRQRIETNRKQETVDENGFSIRWISCCSLLEMCEK